MKFKFNGHNYSTGIWHGIKSRFSKWFGSYKTPVTTWIGHGMGCCDYWITDPKEIERAIMLDDDMGLKRPKP